MASGHFAPTTVNKMIHLCFKQSLLSVFALPTTHMVQILSHNIKSFQAVEKFLQKITRIYRLLQILHLLLTSVKFVKVL